MTHDLLRDAFEAVGAEILDVVIDELREGTFFAKVRYVHDGEEGQLDSRPSDAVALAVRVDAPIYVSPSVLNEAGIPTEDEGAMPMAEAPQPEEVEERTATPMSRLEKIEDQLNQAIRDEDYERAAQLRDEIARIKGKQN
jgi:uncharacterized protein